MHKFTPIYAQIYPHIAQENRFGKKNRNLVKCINSGFGRDKKTS